MEQIVLSRVLRALGAKTLLTNACGGISEHLKVAT